VFGDKEFDGVGYPTPSSIPVERGYRTAKIPADAAWYGVFMGLVETLMDERNWQQFEGGISREDAACYWAEIVDSLYESAMTGPCCPSFRRNPATGLPEVSYDDGLTWDYFPEGPYEDADGPPIAPAPPALNKGSDDADRCFAAWNAADVIAAFYQQTAGQAAAGLYNAVLNVNMFLFQLNQSLLKLIYPSEAQIAQALGFFNFDWPTYASAPTLDSDAMDALRCLLYDKASVTDGIVSFDQPAVLSSLIGTLGINPGTAVTLLVGYMDVAGLNAAGGTQSNTTADCEGCDEWEYTFDFSTGSQQGWSIVNPGPGGPRGYWLGNEFGGRYISPTATEIRLARMATSTHYTGIAIEYAGTHNVDFSAFNHNVTLTVASGIRQDVSITTDNIRVDMANSGNTESTMRMSKITFWGDGTNPF